MSATHLVIDYRPHRVDFRGLQAGDYAQLAHVFPLENVRVDMIPVRLRGLPGWGRVLGDAAAIWADDMARHQVHRYLAGVQPIGSLVAVGASAADMVLAPVREMRRSGRLTRGVVQGTGNFVKTLATETVNVTAKLAQGAQSLLETVDGAIGASPTNGADALNAQPRGRRSRVARGIPPMPRHRTGAGPPTGYHDGLRQAYESLSNGFRSAAHGIVVVPRHQYQQTGAGSAITSALRAVPSALLRPMIGATEALGKALVGVQHAVDPIRQKEIDDRYKRGFMR